MTPSMQPGALVDRLGGFAARIAARYLCGIGAPFPIARRVRRLGGLALVVLRTSPAVRMSQTGVTQLRLHLAPRFSFLSQSRATMKLVLQKYRVGGERVVVTAGAAASAAQTVRMQAPPLIAAARRPLELVTQREQVIVAASATVPRDAAATVSRVTGAASPSRTPQAMRRETLVQPLARGVAHAAERPLAVAIRRLETTVQTLASRTQAEIPAPPRVPAPAFPDTSAIADEVLRTLDHRVIAMRERMGRR